jgi:hypothetical protein
METVESAPALGAFLSNTQGETRKSSIEILDAASHRRLSAFDK